MWDFLAFLAEGPGALPTSRQCFLEVDLIAGIFLGIRDLQTNDSVRKMMLVAVFHGRCWVLVFGAVVCLLSACYGSY